MCKLIRVLDGIPQYQFCEEYAKAKTKLNELLIQQTTIHHELQIAIREFKSIQKNHTPLKTP